MGTGKPLGFALIKYPRHRDSGGGSQAQCVGLRGDRMVPARLQYDILTVGKPRPDHH
ncbi:hypothetical protein ABN034_33645 [Actinopolymorpha sp. B11F2]|uniref:hypothetical protein n=1 Tax=Actinopolymorpha sp. B11F2 TaxID=3160862 RepID=UPI0032E4EEC9